MLKKVNLVLCATALIFSCSDETREEPINITGEIQGSVELLTESGWYEPDQSGAAVLVEGTPEKVQVRTDMNGKFKIQNLPFGTYNLIGTKEGFAATKITGVRIAGGTEPFYQSITVVRPSTARLENVSLSYATGLITVRGTLVHSVQSAYPFAGLVAFLSTSPDVSSEKYMQSASNGFSFSSGTPITWGAFGNPGKFQPGTKIYVKVYGFVSAIPPIFNYEKARYDYLGLSATSSNTVSIVL